MPGGDRSRGDRGDRDDPRRGHRDRHDHQRHHLPPPPTPPETAAQQGRGPPVPAPSARGARSQPLQADPTARRATIMRPPPTSRPMLRTTASTASSDTSAACTPARYRGAAPPRQSAMESPAPRSLCSSGASNRSSEEDSDGADYPRRSPPARTKPQQVAHLFAGRPPLTRTTSTPVLDAEPAQPVEVQSTPGPSRRPRSPVEDSEAKRHCAAQSRAAQRDPRIARHEPQDEGRTYAQIATYPPNITATNTVTTATTRGAAATTNRPPCTAATETTVTETATKQVKPKRRYPPLIVELLPNWAQHMRELKRRLGRAANARPFGKGLRFTPKDDQEFRLVQRYLTELEKTDGISWFTYSLPEERSLKVAIRGLPSNATPEEVEEELRDLGYVPEYVRTIRGRGDRPGCILLAILKRTPNTTPGIYEVEEMLGIPGVKIEAWRGKKRPAQCHRCQQFRHSSHNCHRRLACVRCGGDHPASNCPRPREEPATCANCGGEHPANNIHCPVFQRELRNKKAGTVAITGEPRQRPAPVNPQPTGERSQGASLMAEANPPSPRGTSATSTKGRRRKRGGRRGKPQAALTDTEIRGSDLATDPRPPSTRPTAAAPIADTAAEAAGEVKGRPAQTPGATSGTRGSASATATTKTTKNEDTKAVIQAAIRILQEVMTALSEERDTATILQITLKGVADLITRYG